MLLSGSAIRPTWVAFLTQRSSIGRYNGAHLLWARKAYIYVTDCVLLKQGRRNFPSVCWTCLHAVTVMQTGRLLMSEQQLLLLLSKRFKLELRYFDLLWICCKANWILATDDLKLTANVFWLAFCNMANVTQNDDVLDASVGSPSCQQLKLNILRCFPLLTFTKMGIVTVHAINLFVTPKQH